MNRDGAISEKDEDKNIFYIVRFIYVTYTLQKDMESDGNTLASGDLVWNGIYTSTRQPK